MNVLYVVGSCLTKNTSANMSHNSYVQGLLENGCQVDILMAQDSWGQQDAALPRWEQARYFEYGSISLQDKIRNKVRGIFGAPAAPVPVSEGAETGQTALPRATIRSTVRFLAKKLYYRCFPVDPLYPLEHTWLKKAAAFRAEKTYDLVVSNSSPAASHKLVGTLLQNKQLQCKRWVQIWEDPWYSDLYGLGSEQVRQEEHALLQMASEVYYVSPLTMEYQKKLFPDCAEKIRHIPLPYLEYSEADDQTDGEISFGYFGDYYSVTRNLEPFYRALKGSGYRGNIYGDTDLNIEATPQITVSGRVTLDILARVQAQTKVLVHLCNLRGGQIPGKIYHYSATEKPILFILDGTPEERDILRHYFSRFDRYYFCENNEVDILETMDRIIRDVRAGKTWLKVTDFSPAEVVKQLLDLRKMNM